MTGEIPKKRIAHCTDCNSRVYVQRENGQGLTVTCGCETDRSIRVKKALPEGWQV